MKKIFYLIFCLAIVVSCSKDEDDTSEAKTNNFQSAEEYLENPSVSQAIKKAGVSVNLGDNPPVLSGDYDADGRVIKAGEPINNLIGLDINSLFSLYNQTSSGKISFHESVNGINVWGSGGYITGDNSRFTIWQESKQRGEEAGLPDNVTVTIALVMIGTKLSNGDLSAKGISIITDATSSNSDYQVNEQVIKDGELWWMWDVDFALQNKTVSSTKNKPSNLVFHNIYELLFEKVR
ncbi:MAG: hypothetical protein JKX79_11735 [Labilibaculum sp.]|nr:hypothetical protein [Labilibaculum sp.]